MIKKIFSLTATILLLIAAFSFSVFAEKKNKSVYDLAGLFTESEIAEMEHAAAEFCKKTNYDIYIVTENKTPYNDYDGSVDYWGDNFVDDYLNGNAGDCVVLIITDNKNRNYNLYTYGSCDRRISDSEVNEILDAPLVYDNIKGASNYSVAITEFIELCSDACQARIGLAVVIAVLSGMAVSAVTGWSIVYTYKKKSRTDKYPLNRFADLELTQSNDIFMGSFVTRLVINQGGRSGGGSRGGGGGGGHRGGR